MPHEHGDERRAKIEALFDELLDLRPDDRARRLEDIEREDLAIARELRSLLAHDDPASDDGRGITIHATPRPATTRRLGPYAIERELGSGGMGTVYLADQLEPIRRQVALKTIRPDLVNDHLRVRFELERDSLARMDHPGIPRVFDAGCSDDGQLYFAMEYVEGVPITNWCARAGWSVRAKLELFVRVCHAVQHAHEKGVIHRDIKPANVLITTVDGEATPKLIDFGIARESEFDATAVTAAGQMVGTPEYMSPEQVRFDHSAVDTRSDVYSLGLLLYELLVGDLPFDRDALRRGGPAELQRLILEAHTPRPSSRVTAEFASETETQLHTLRTTLRGDLDNVVMRALEKDRDRRYPSPSALADDLERYLRSEPVLATPPSRLYLARKFARRHRGAVVAGIALFAMLVLGLIGTTSGYFAARRDAEEARRSLQESGLVAKFLNELIGAAPTAQDGREITLREALEAAAARIETELSQNAGSAATVHHAVGRAYRSLRMFDEARFHLGRCLELNRPSIAASPERSSLHRTTCQILSEIERRSRNLDAALDWVRRGLEPPLWDDVQDRTVHQSLRLGYARILMLQDKPDEAEAIIRAVWDDPVVSSQLVRERLTIRSDLSVILQRRGRLEDAERVQREVLAGRIALLGPTHEAVCRTYLDHAAQLRGLGRYEEAAEQYRRGAETARSRWGDVSPELGRALLGQAHLARHAERRVTAAELYRSALTVLEAVYGVDAAGASSVRHGLGSLLTELGEFEAADRVLVANRDALALVDGGPPKQWEFTLRRLGQLRAAQDRLDEAAQLLGESLLRAKITTPKVGYPETLIDLAEIARRRGDRTRAHEYLQRAAIAYDCPQAVDDPAGEHMPATLWRCCAARLAHDEGAVDRARVIADVAYRRAMPRSLVGTVEAMACRVALAEDPSQLRDDLRQLLKRIRATADEGDPWITRVEAWLQLQPR